MKKNTIIIIAIILIGGTILLSTILSDSSDNQTSDDLNTSPNLKQALNDAKIENKKVLLIFDQDNCYYCDLFKEDTLSNSDVQEILNKKYIVVTVDINKEGAIANKFKIFGTPSTIFLNNNGKEIHRIEGYVPADEFLNSIKEI